MVRVLQIFCVLIFLLTGAVLALCIIDLGHQDPEVQSICQQPSFLQRFDELHSKQDIPTEKESPLVVQAQAFAAYLNGPVVQEKQAAVVAGRTSVEELSCRKVSAMVE